MGPALTSRSPFFPKFVFCGLECDGTAVSDPFADLKLASFEPLHNLDARTTCPKCLLKRKFFCYDCHLPMDREPSHTPHLKLPIICDVVHYETEAQSKSTAVHAKVVAYESVKVHRFPSDSLEEWDPDETVVLFPSDDAVPVEELDFGKVKRVVFLECQWHNAKRILRDERISKLKHVKIGKYETRFWRWQNVGNECLATIEAIYYFYKEYVTATNPDKVYHGEVDNLLYYFVFTYNLLQSVYKRSGKDFHRIKGFINEDPDNSDHAFDKIGVAPPEKTTGHAADYDGTFDLTAFEEEE